MRTTTKREYIRITQKRYFTANRKQKSLILNELSQTLAIHRKSAIRLLGNPPQPKKSTRTPRPFLYSKKVIWILEELWRMCEYPCGTILKACTPLWMPFLKKHYQLDPSTEASLFKISASTIDRRLKEKRMKLKSKIYGKTKPGLILRNQIPIKTSSLNIGSPGSLELDLVSHSGFSAAGEFVYTLNSVDIFSQWVERRACYGKSHHGVQKAFESIRQALPFDLIDIDFDNGSEFINWDLIHYCKLEKIGFTRSRPYEKDDQAHIEQKNSTHVRRLFGRIRFDKPSVAVLLNDLYQNELRLFHNFFKPSLKLIKKRFIGAKTIRTFDKPRTPYHRLLADPYFPKHKRKILTDLFRSLDPICLKHTIQRKISKIYQEQNKNPIPKTDTPSHG